jgi:hypothetical protein
MRSVFVQHLHREDAPDTQPGIIKLKVNVYQRCIKTKKIENIKEYKIFTRCSLC